MWTLPLSSMRTEATFSNFWFVTPSIRTPLRNTEPARAETGNSRAERTRAGMARRGMMKTPPG
ncbi:hypothetical protein F0U59_32375 [Archangium gephyra]|nr:hypothetical protein F0U59_32375 [Archangium gephyra]